MNTTQTTTMPELSRTQQLRVVQSLLGSANLGVMPSAEMSTPMLDCTRQKVGDRSFSYKCMRFLAERAIPRQDLLQKGMREVMHVLLAEPQKQGEASKNKQSYTAQVLAQRQAQQQAAARSSRNSAEMRGEMLGEMFAEGAHGSEQPAATHEQYEVSQEGSNGQVANQEAWASESEGQMHEQQEQEYAVSRPGRSM